MGKTEETKDTDDIVTEIMVRILIGDIPEDEAKDKYGVEVGHF